MLSLPGKYVRAYVRVRACVCGRAAEQSSSHLRWERRSPVPMLRAGRMEEFVTEEEEPWYDQRDLEQGEASFYPVSCLRSWSPSTGAD